MAQPRVPLADRIWKHVTRGKDTECWLWTGALSYNGYGRVMRGRPQPGLIPAHRAMYELLVGRVPQGMSLHHTCEVRRCVNPAHLVPMSIGANVLLNSGPTAQNARLLNCPRCGSQFAYRRDGHRVCLTCKAAYNKARFARLYEDPAWRAAWQTRSREWWREHH